MTLDQRHPSFMELDALALEAPGHDRARAHLAACERCCAYVADTERTQEVPAWVRRLANREQPRPNRRATVAWAAALAGAAVAVALVAVVLPGDHAPPTPYVGVKGAPALALYVREDDKVTLWDGRRTVRPGAGLRLKVDPAGLTHVQVFARVTRGAGKGIRELYAARLPPDAPTLLPTAWKVDDEAGAEVLIVVLARSALPRDAVMALVEQTGAHPHAWVRTLRIPKDTGKGR